MLYLAILEVSTKLITHLNKMGTKQTPWRELITAEACRGQAFDLLKRCQIPSNGSYEKAFGGTAISRASRKQLLRNAAVVLKNQGGKSK